MMMECEVAPLIMSGELRKRCTGWIKRWARRYWELRSDGYLSYFSSARSTHTRRGLVDVKHECRRVLFGLQAQAEGGGTWPSDPEATFLLLVTDRRLFCLAADTPYDCQAWIQALSAFAAVGGANGVPEPPQRPTVLIPAPTDEYDALKEDGTNGGFDALDPWAQDVEIVYDSPMRDMTLRGDATIRLEQTDETPPRVPARLRTGHAMLSMKVSDAYEPYEFSESRKGAPAQKKAKSSSGRRKKSTQRKTWKLSRKPKIPKPPPPRKPSRLRAAISGRTGQPAPAPRRPRAQTNGAVSCAQVQERDVQTPNLKQNGTHAERIGNGHDPLPVPRGRQAKPTLPKKPSKFGARQDREIRSRGETTDSTTTLNASRRTDERAQQASKWVEKELSRLIKEIQRLGKPLHNGCVDITFGVLFDELSDTFEALSGTLRMAKKRQIVTYDGDLLLQGVHTGVHITLLRDSVPNGSAFRVKSDGAPPLAARRGKPFPETSLQTSNSKCFICDKIVYAAEFVGISGKALHRRCFRCRQCNKQLSTSNYATIHDMLYCKPHYEQIYMRQGCSYSGYN